jgi:hypothetical protein
VEKDHLEIILESIDNKLDLIIEGQTSLGLQLDECIREAKAGLSRSKKDILPCHFRSYCSFVTDLSSTPR